MATKRKTFGVADFKKWVNAMLEGVHTQDEKRALCTALEMVLHDTGNYQGYNSIKWLQGGCTAWNEAGQPEDKQPFMGLEYDRHYY